MLECVFGFMNAYVCVCVCNPSLPLPVLSTVSELLGLDSLQLSEVLTQSSMILRGEEICSPLTIEQVTHTRMHTHTHADVLS